MNYNNPLNELLKIVHKRGENYGSNTYELQNTGYYIFFICLAVISCFSNPGMVVLAGCRVDNIDQAE